MHCHVILRWESLRCAAVGYDTGDGKRTNEIYDRQRLYSLAAAGRADQGNSAIRYLRLPAVALRRVLFRSASVRSGKNAVAGPRPQQTGRAANNYIEASSVNG